ncbi:MAG: histidine phosphatase family protein [Cyclobacteriaceae bacterium]
MSGKKIYLIRHGQTDFNLKGIVQGSGVDTSLNDLGRRQAHAFFECYGHVAFDKIYTSALKRTVESVQPFIDAGNTYEQLAGLNEISWGKHEGKPITPDEDRYYQWMLKSWREGRTELRIEGGESPEEVIARQRPAVDHIMSRPQEKTVLVCMHGRAIRILLCLLLKEPLCNMDNFEHQNLCLYQLALHQGRWTVERANDTTHLQPIRLMV